MPEEPSQPLHELLLVRQIRRVEGDEPIPGTGYRLAEFLGRGGFGEVWKATGPGGTDAALKIINAGKNDRLLALAPMFQTAAKQMDSLSAKNSPIAKAVAKQAKLSAKQG